MEVDRLNWPAAENGARAIFATTTRIRLGEDVEFEDSIAESVRWLGYDWRDRYHASDYYDALTACRMVHRAGSRMSTARRPRDAPCERDRTRTASPYRNRSIAENLELFRRMRAGGF
jgi:glutaminyl-tRNA synthetase